MKKLITVFAICLTTCVFGQTAITGLKITTAMPIAEDLDDHTGIKVHLRQATIRDNGNVVLIFSTKLSDSTNCTPSLIGDKVVEINSIDYDWSAAYLLLKQAFSNKGIATQNE